MDACGHYCSHGGWCILGKGHGGELHDPGGYCQWFSSESLTKEQADADLRDKPGGQQYLDARDLADSGE